MAEKEIKETVVTVADGVTVTVTDNYDDVETYLKQLKIARRIKNPESIDITHPDVVRLADAEGIKIKKSISTQDAEALQEILWMVQDHQVTLLNEAKGDALAIQRLSDIFDSQYNEKIRIRPDLAKLSNQAAMIKVYEGYFAQPVTDRFMPSPAKKLEKYPVEQKSAICAVFMEVVCPDFFSQYRAALTASDDSQLVIDGGEGSVDSDGFQSERVD